MLMMFEPCPWFHHLCCLLFSLLSCFKVIHAHQKEQCTQVTQVCFQLIPHFKTNRQYVKETIMHCFKTFLIMIGINTFWAVIWLNKHCHIQKKSFMNPNQHEKLNILYEIFKTVTSSHFWMYNKHFWRCEIKFVIKTHFVCLLLK